MNLIGHHYTEPQNIVLNNKQVKIQKGSKIRTIEPAYCERQLHYFRYHKPIPEGTELIVNYSWMNFYGVKINVNYNNIDWDLNPDCLEFIE